MSLNIVEVLVSAQQFLSFSSDFLRRTINNLVEYLSNIFFLFLMTLSIGYVGLG